MGPSQPPAGARRRGEYQRLGSIVVGCGETQCDDSAERDAADRRASQMEAVERRLNLNGEIVQGSDCGRAAGTFIA